MNDTHIDHVEMDDVLRELRAELDVTPSPEFAAKVRARVAETAASRALRWAPQWAMWGALAATAAGVIAFASTRTTGTIAPPAVSVPAIAPTAWRAEAPPSRRRPAPAAPVWKAPVRKAAAQAALDAPRATAPVLEVITNQPALIRRAFEQAALLREYPINQPAIPGPIEPLTLTKVVIDPIVIPGGTDVPPGGVSPVIRRVSAVEPTRSPQ